MDATDQIIRVSRALMVVVIYLIFATLLSLVGDVDGVTRSTPVVWEWFAFGTLMF